MTVCVLWRDNDDSLYCAADSRISSKNVTLTDYATKIHQIRLRHSPLLNESPWPSKDFGYVCVAFAGNLYCAASTIMYCSTVLQNLITSETKPFPKIVDVIDFVVGVAQAQLEFLAFKDGIDPTCEFILFGPSWFDGSFFIYRITLDKTHIPFIFKKQDLSNLSGSNAVVIGKEVAYRKCLDSLNNFDPVKALRILNDDKSLRDVGGQIHLIRCTASECYTLFELRPTSDGDHVQEFHLGLNLSAISTELSKRFGVYGYSTFSKFSKSDKINVRYDGE